MYRDKLPDFKNKTVLFRMINVEIDTTIENPMFEMLSGRLFVTGRMTEGSSQNDWLAGLVTSLAWDCVQGYVVFDSLEDYLARASLAWSDKQFH